MTATITHLTDFDSRELTYAVSDPDGTHSFIKAADAASLLAALIPGYDALTAALDAAEAKGSPKATQRAYNALLDARRAHAHGRRVAMQRQINADAKADGTWAALTDVERAELTRAASGAVPLGILVDEETWIAGIPYLMTVGRWDATVPLVVNRCDYALWADGDVWNEEPVGNAMLVLDPTDDDLYVESLETVGIVAVTEDHDAA